MKRLATAAVLALGLHATLFWVPMPWTQPVMLSPQSRVVDISLVTFQKPMETPARPKPKKVQPRPKKEPEPPKKPEAKPIIRPRPAPRPVQPAPEPKSAPEPLPIIEAPTTEPSVDEITQEAETAHPEDQTAAFDEARAAVKVSVPLYDLNPPPVYPRVARRRNYQGTVLLDVRVTADGYAAEVKLAQSSGYSVLDQSALTAVQAWRFEPARRGTHPIETWVQVPVRFEIR